MYNRMSRYAKSALATVSHKQNFHYVINIELQFENNVISDVKERIKV